MGTRSKSVDAYIAKSADFAKPVMTHFRDAVHQACPDVVESLKWSAPAFEYHGILCNMASFKAHCSIGFWKHELVMEAPHDPKSGMGSFGKLTSVKQLPSKRELTRLIKRAMQLNVDGVSVERPSAASKPQVAMHPEFKAALTKHRKARAFFDQLSPRNQREYLEWILDAKRDATRERRIAQAVEWLGEGKRRNWKYESC